MQNQNEYVVFGAPKAEIIKNDAEIAQINEHVPNMVSPPSEPISAMRQKINISQSYKV